MSTKGVRSKVRISLRSARFLAEIDRAVRQANTRGPMERFRDVASDVLDGWAMRNELDELIRCRFLEVVHHGFDDSKKFGPDPLRFMNPKMCGSSWSVNATEKLIRTFWADRLST